jgi:hypothetical protein
MKTKNWIDKKIINIGVARCDNCYTTKECILIKFNWFCKKKLCESCISSAFRKLDSEV